MQQDPPSKSYFKDYILTNIAVFYEKELRNMAIKNSQMKYFNVSLSRLSGRLHPAASWVSLAQEVAKIGVVFSEDLLVMILA